MSLAYKASGKWSLIGAGVSAGGLVFAVAWGNVNPERAGASFVLMAAAMIFWLTVAGTYFIRSKREALTIVLPAGIPPRLNSNDDVRSGFKEGVLPVYAPGPRIVNLVRRLRGGQIGYGDLAAHQAAEAVVTNLKLVGALLAPMILVAAPSLGAISGRGWAIVGALLGVGCATWLWTWSWRVYKDLDPLFPAHGPAIDGEEHLRTVQGGGDPFVLKSELEQSLMAIRRHNQPNWTISEDWNRPQVTLAEAGRLNGTISIENRSEYDGAPDEARVKPYLERSRTSFSVAALSTIAALSFFPIGLQLAGAGVVLSFFFIAASDQVFATRILRAYNWRSVLCYVEVEASVGKTEIRAGRAITDSLESSNVVLRSDCHVRVYSGEIRSQSLSLEGARGILEIHPTEESRRAAQLALMAIDGFAHGGTRIRGIDVTGQAMDSTVRANLAIESAKAGVRATALQGSGASDGFGTLVGGSQPQLTPPNPTVASSSQDRSLSSKPEFAWHEVSTRPMKCPKCGHVNAIPEGQLPACANCGHT